MLKFSLNIAITNSVRINLSRECHRAIASHQLLQSPIGQHFSDMFPHFTVITDSAFMALRVDGEIYEPSICLYRNNPFSGINEHVSLIAGLTETHPFTGQSRLAAIVKQLAKSHHINPSQAGLLWYKHYLSSVVAPVLWLYCEYGIALEAHQQNLLVELKDGLPVKGYYRDSQGFYFVGQHEKLQSKDLEPLLTHLCEGSVEFVEHHFSYYFIVNQLIMLMHAVSIASSIEEKALIDATQKFLAGFSTQYKTNDRYTAHLLKSTHLPAKANLLTRLKGLDELQVPLETQSVYIDIPNPFEAKHAYL